VEFQRNRAFVFLAGNRGGTDWGWGPRFRRFFSTKRMAFKDLSSPKRTSIAGPTISIHSPHIRQRAAEIIWALMPAVSLPIRQLPCFATNGGPSRLQTRLGTGIGDSGVFQTGGPRICGISTTPAKTLRPQWVNHLERYPQSIYRKSRAGTGKPLPAGWGLRFAGENRWVVGNKPAAKSAAKRSHAAVKAHGRTN